MHYQVQSLVPQHPVARHPHRHRRQGAQQMGVQSTGAATKLAQPPSGSAYAIAAGGHQQNSIASPVTRTSSSSSPPNVCNTVEQSPR